MKYLALILLAATAFAQSDAPKVDSVIIKWVPETAIDAATGHNVTISWQPSTQPTGETISLYRVYRSLNSGGPFVQRAQVAAQYLRWSDINVISGKTYFYYIESVDKQKHVSDPSITVGATIP